MQSNPRRSKATWPGLDAPPRKFKSSQTVEDILDEACEFLSTELMRQMERELTHKAGKDCR